MLLDLGKHLSNIVVVAAMIWQRDYDTKLHFPNDIGYSVKAVLPPYKPCSSFRNGTSFSLVFLDDKNIKQNTDETNSQYS